MFVIIFYIAFICSVFDTAGSEPFFENSVTHSICLYELICKILLHVQSHNYEQAYTLFNAMYELMPDDDEKRLKFIHGLSYVSLEIFKDENASYLLFLHNKGWNAEAWFNLILLESRSYALPLKPLAYYSKYKFYKNINKPDLALINFKIFKNMAEYNYYDVHFLQQLITQENYISDYDNWKIFLSDKNRQL